MPQQLDEVERLIIQLEIEKEAIKRENDKSKLKSIEEQLANLHEECSRYRADYKDFNECTLCY